MRNGVARHRSLQLGMRLRRRLVAQRLALFEALGTRTQSHRHRQLLQSKATSPIRRHLYNSYRLCRPAAAAAQTGCMARGRADCTAHIPRPGTGKPSVKRKPSTAVTGPVKNARFRAKCGRSRPARKPPRQRNRRQNNADLSRPELPDLTVCPTTSRIVTTESKTHDMPGPTTVTSFGRVISVRGSLARVGLLAASQMGLSEVRATVGRFVSIRCANSTIVAMITDVTCEDLPTSDTYIASAGGRSARRNPRRPGPPQIPARRHQLSDHRRCRRPDHQSGAAHGLCADRIGPDQCRHPAAGPFRHRLCRYRGNAEQAFRGARLHRRR